MTGRRSESTTTDFDHIYAANAPRLVSQLYLVIGDLSEAQDCVQEAFARAWLRWDSLTDGRGDPVGWVKTTAYRLAVSHWRHWKGGLRALRRHGPPPHAPGPSPDAIALRDALARLPRSQRVALVLHHMNDMRVEDIARELRVPTGTVKARLVRGRAALALMLADWDAEDLAKEESHA